MLMGRYGVMALNKGDILTVYVNGEVMTLCILGFYNEEASGEEMVILALINQDNLLHIPLENLESVFSSSKHFN